MDRSEKVKVMLLEFAREKAREGLRARFFFFGSRVRGDFKERSDFDLAVDAGAPLDPITLGRLRDDLEKLPTLYRIDLVDAAATSSRFRAEAFAVIEKIT